MLFQFTNEFGARFFILANYVKCFYENKGTMRDLHKALSVIETVQGDLYYVKDSVEDIVRRFTEMAEKNAMKG